MLLSLSLSLCSPHLSFVCVCVLLNFIDFLTIKPGLLPVKFVIVVPGREIKNFSFMGMIEKILKSLHQVIIAEIGTHQQQTERQERRKKLDLLSDHWSTRKLLFKLERKFWPYTHMHTSKKQVNVDDDDDDTHMHTRSQKVHFPNAVTLMRETNWPPENKVRSACT